jgi:alpha-mannosidase
VLSALITGRKYDGYILRVFEAYSSRGKCEIDFCKAIESVTECNLMEKDGEALSHCEKSFVFDIKPNEVKTFRIKFK